MKLHEIREKLDLVLKSSVQSLDVEVTAAYSSDILSDVISHAREGNIWLTLHTHSNIVAVAGLQSLAGIILVGGRQPEEDTLERANKEQIPILTTKLSAFEIAGRLYELGIRG